jgi:hypothetical protein
MRLLLSLILALSEEEATRISAIRLRGKQRAVMNLLFACRLTGNEPTDADIASLQVSDSHLYEITSVLLGKCLHQLVPAGGIAVLEFIAYKNLNILFKQELRKQRKKLSSQKGKEAEDFFLSGFELLLRFTYNLIDSELIAEYGSAYLAAKKQPSAFDALAIEIRMLQIRMISVLAEGKNYGKEQEMVLEKLREAEHTARNGTHSYLSFSVYSALAWYWQHLGGKLDISLRYFQRAVPFSEKLEGYVFREMPDEMKLRLADAQFMLGGSYESFEIFERVYASVSPNHIVWKRNYYLFRYLEILIYNGKYYQAEQILKRQFEPSFTLRPTTASATAASLLAVLYLFTGDHRKSYHYLKIGMVLNRKGNFTLYNEVRNRYIEAMYYYLTDDWSHSSNLISRTMQYLYSRHIGLNKHNFGYFFKVIEASMAYVSQGKRFPKKLESKYKELTLPKEGLFGLLLKKVRIPSLPSNGN